MSAAELALVANIGGTNARFGLALPSRTRKPEVIAIKQYLVSEFDNFVDAAAHYLREIESTRPTQGIFAVASVVNGDEVRITNNTWTFSAAAASRSLGLREARVINDFAAVSRSVRWLEREDVCSFGPSGLKPVLNTSDATYAVVGPGTGLGVGCLAIRQNHAVVIESEGGHVSFAPSDRYEIGVLDRLLGEYDRISVERLISGAGMVNLYKAVCSLEGVPVTLGSPEAITAGAAAQPGGICARTLKLFCGLLGSFAGDVALSFGAWDGVFIAGGIAQKIVEWFEAGGFRRRFEDKGRHRSLMKAIPTHVVLHPHAELLGAAAA